MNTIVINLEVLPIIVGILCFITLYLGGIRISIQDLIGAYIQR